MAQQQLHRQQYTSDLLEWAVYQHYTLHCSTADIAKQLNISQRVVQRTLRMWRIIGRVKLPITRAYQPKARVLSHQHCQFILGILKHNPDLYLDEIAEQLQLQHGLDVSLPTVW
ncbi:hypothetical protein BDM02DRAFT_3188762 [Thelephora ganbajun]|uniref:Uncharacterized protein n=1 Tax=Thelephora ganbajun TaxID=370292 RepID=A0ACB6ZAD6_THEGA|nr:hypothetical protein BDM02DRAFT_3188762 [Thelephora ganbajun]